jgi:FkbM family methyltransferase
MKENQKSDGKAKKSLRSIIRKHYNTSTPNFASICYGLRRISINPADRRVQSQLLRHGVRHMTKIQALIYTFVSRFKPELFVDVGVNYGECLFGLPFNSKTKIVGFEANPNLLPYIEKSKIYNDDLDVRLVSCACSDVADQPISFFINNRWSGNSTAVPDPQNMGGPDLTEVQVSTTTLDKELLGIVPADSTVFVKVDVEGFEPKVILGAKQFNDSVKNLVYLIEFDTSFLERGELPPEKFFLRLAEEFTIYLAQRGAVARIGSYEELSGLADARARIHCDFLLVRSQDPSFLEAFEREFLGRRISEMVRSVKEG